MSRIVFCQKLKREAAGLEYKPYPGPQGERIFENISQEAWQQWLSHLSVLINDYQINTSDREAVAFIEQHMLGFLFGEGEFGSPGATFRPPSRKK